MTNLKVLATQTELFKKLLLNHEEEKSMEFQQLDTERVKWNPIVAQQQTDIGLTVGEAARLKEIIEGCAEGKGVQRFTAMDGRWVLPVMAILEGSS